MDFNKILEQLRAERAQLAEAIIALERIQLGSGKRRGRPPKWMQEAKLDLPSPSKRREKQKSQSSADAA